MAMSGYSALIFMLFVMDREGISQAAGTTFETMFDEVLSLKSNVVEHVRQSSSAAAQEVATVSTTTGEFSECLRVRTTLWSNCNTRMREFASHVTDVSFVAGAV